VTVPCDTPNFPADLVLRLAQAADAAQADIACAQTTEADGRPRTHPVFCLMKAALAESLSAFLDGGGRKIDAWFAQQRTAAVPFDDASAFFNANTPQELARLQQ
jgi:molybdopterin-guanine dinucleotide biosynthesis protein A